MYPKSIRHYFLLFLFFVTSVVLFQNCSPSTGFSTASENPEVPMDHGPDDILPVLTIQEILSNIAMNDLACKKVSPFYWEIGNKNAILASGQVGSGAPTRETQLTVASASKWLFGAYSIERVNGNLDAQTIRHLTMHSGYSNFENSNCFLANTIQGCYYAGENYKFSTESFGKFFYSGGHFQKLAMLQGLGTLDNPQLVVEMQKYLGADIQFEFGSPQVAGGVRISTDNYVRFLSKILNENLFISQKLGDEAVCTLPGPSCDAVYSPLSDASHYSLGHWVEDDPKTGDGAFSSAGAFGYYPWIDSSQQFYGVLARQAEPNSNSPAIDSMDCGRKIRKAFLDSERVLPFK